MCLLSSATYLVNDVRDREQDRQHPCKRSATCRLWWLSPSSGSLARRQRSPRRVCSPAVSSPLAWALVACAYLALTASYSLWLRHVVVARHPGDRGRLCAARRRGRRCNRHLPVALVCHRDGVLCRLSGCRQALRRAARARAVGDRRATLRLYSLGRFASDDAGGGHTCRHRVCGWAFTRPSHVLLYGLSIVPLLLWFGRYASLIARGRRPGARGVDLGRSERCWHSASSGACYSSAASMSATELSQTSARRRRRAIAVRLGAHVPQSSPRDHPTRNARMSLHALPRTTHRA